MEIVIGQILFLVEFCRVEGRKKHRERERGKVLKVFHLIEVFSFSTVSLSIPLIYISTILSLHALSLSLLLYVHHSFLHSLQSIFDLKRIYSRKKSKTWKEKKRWKKRREKRGIQVIWSRWKNFQLNIFWKFIRV